LPVANQLTHYLSLVYFETGLPRLLESPRFFSLKFQDLESPGKSLRSWKVLEKSGRKSWKMHIFLLVVIEKKQKYNFIHFVLILTNLNSWSIMPPSAFYTRHIQVLPLRLRIYKHC